MLWGVLKCFISFKNRFVKFCFSDFWPQPDHLATLCAASVWSSPIEGPPALRPGSGRWPARHLAGQFTSGEAFVAATHAGADGLPVCEIATKPRLSRCLPAPPGRDCTPGAHFLFVTASWINSLENLCSVSGCPVFWCRSSVSPLKMTATASQLSTPVMSDPSM